jgi:iron complex outermembrane recepter protein
MSKKSTAKGVVGIAVAAAAAGAPSNALAQERTAELLSEITVSAQRREQSIQDIPLAVSAFSGEFLANRNIDTPGAIAFVVPNVQLQDNGLVTRLNIRGVTLTDTGDANEAPVSLYIDDVYQAFVAAMPLALFDVDRVEVLRGPQGTLYGRNSTGGLVHYISRRPTDSAEGYAGATFGSFGRVMVEGAIGGPLSGGLRGRLAFRVNNDDGWQTNDFTGEKWGKTESWAVRAQLEADLSDAVDVRFSGHYSDNKGRSPGYAFFGARNPANPATVCGYDDVINGRCVSFGANSGYPAGGFRVPDPSPKHILSQKRDPANDTTGKGGSITLNWELSGMKLTSITAYEALERFQEEDYEASQFRPGDIDDVFADNDQFSQEVRLTSTDSRISWVLGAYYFDSTAEVGLGYPGFGLPIVNESTVDTESLALFGQADFPFGDRWTATFGARYTNEDKSHDGILYSDAALTIADQFRYDVSDSIVTWRAALSKSFDSALLYGSVATGFKSPAFNTTGLFSRTEGAPTESEELTSFEVGYKATLADGRASVALAAFYYDYENVQGVYTDPATRVQVFANFGDSENYGLEFESRFAFTDNLSAKLSAGYLSTKIDSPDPALNGRELPSSPEWSTNGQVRYEVPLQSVGKLAFQADFRWQSDYYFSPQNNPIARTDSYGLVDLSASWTSMNERYSIRAFVENVTDEEYLTHAFSIENYTGTVTGIWGRPLTWGVSGRISF